MTVTEQLQQELDQSKRARDLDTDGWQLNIDERRGKATTDAADESRSMVPVDWTITKTKSAQLWSQMPQVRLTPKHASFGQAVPVFAKVVNDLLTEANVEAVMAECVVDCVNAAGIGAAIVRYEELTEVVPLAPVDPVTASMAAMGAPAPAPTAPEEMAEGATDAPAEDVAEGESVTAAVPVAAPAPLPTTRTTDRRFVVDRVSPFDLLRPTSFRLSDWNKAPWLGHTVRTSWARAKRLLNLRDEDKDEIIGAARINPRLNQRPGETQRETDELVEYDEVFYWRYIYHDDETSYDAIHHLVFVAGLPLPAIDEPWKGQAFDELNGGYIGACKLPIQVLTLHYVSDEAIPPSDSAIIRPLVKELQEAQKHQQEQRKHSRPLRWFDVDRIDPTMTADLIKGTWQGMIPTIGVGDKAIGEVAHAQYPRENLEFDRILTQKIQEAVGVGPNQSNTFASGERSASEAQIVQQSFQTEMGQQRARVAAFFVAIAEVMMGLWAKFGVVEPTGIGAALGPDGEQMLASWDRSRINQKFVADIRADSTVRLDAQQLVQQITSVLNITAQSGYINPKKLIERIVELNGMDPTEVMVDPQPHKPEPPKISYAFKGEDLVNLVVLGIIAESGQAPSPQAMAAAHKMLEASVMTAPLAAAAAAPAPAGPHGPVTPEVKGMPTPATPPQHNPAIPEKPFPGWEAANRINTRRSEG